MISSTRPTLSIVINTADLTASRQQKKLQRLVHEDEQPVDPSELPADFIDSSSDSESGSDGGSDCIDLASDAVNYVDLDSESEVDSESEADSEQGVDKGEMYDAD